MLFRMWESINSYSYDERMLAFLTKLVEVHVSPEVSDPRRIAQIPDDEQSEGEQRPNWLQEDLRQGASWPGLYKDVGIFTEHEWNLIMCKCLASMGMQRCLMYFFSFVTEIPLADSGSLTTGPSADSQIGFEIQRLPKPNWRIGIHVTFYGRFSNWAQDHLHVSSSTPWHQMASQNQGLQFRHQR